jgi:hypothetical protein
MESTVTLPVPTRLHATYLVPTMLGDADARKGAQSALTTRVPGPVGAAARGMLDVGAVSVASLPSSAIPPVPVELQEHLGVDQRLVQCVAATDRFAAFSAEWPPGWPPVHEAVARACSAALAADLGVPLIDAFVPVLLAPEAAIAALPDATSKLRLSDWVLVLRSAEATGLWVTTKGMGRFGLPELQTFNVPPQLGGSWSTLLLGVCARLLDAWLDALRERDSAPFVAIPSVFEVDEADVAEAHGIGRQHGGRVRVRLTFDPAPADATESFLTLQPPDDFGASAGEYFAWACAEVFGDSVQEVRYMARTDAMERAIKDARSTLPAVRSRFLAGDLPLSARLMVKHALKTAMGTEYPWAYVNTWTDPATVLGNSAGNAVRDAKVRTGRPIVIDADSIIDWAIWIDGQGIAEGGKTNIIANGEGEQGGL